MTSSVSVGFRADVAQVCLRDRGRQQPAAEVRLHVGENAALQQQPGQAVLFVERGEDLAAAVRRPRPAARRP